MKTGDRFGDYEILARLGAGGMGEVYKVRNTLSQRIEAIKVLRTGEAAQWLERFKREIQIQAALDHPNVARFHTALVIEAQLVLVMEFVEGIALDKLLRDQPPTIRQALDYAGQMLRAIGYAHSRGVVHRDVKPANAIRRGNGSIQLLDFGIAHMRSAQRLTLDGQIIGSPIYMSPEQIRGLEPDPRSDLYSLGILLYEMVVHKPPFLVENRVAMLMAHCEQPPRPPREAASNVPARLNCVILKAIAKDQSQRFQSAEEFLEHLERCRGFQIGPLLLQRQPVFIGGAALAASAIAVVAMGGSRWLPVGANYNRPASAWPPPVRKPFEAPPAKDASANPIPQPAPPPRANRPGGSTGLKPAVTTAEPVSTPSPQSRLTDRAVRFTSAAGLEHRLIDVGAQVTSAESRIKALEVPLQVKGLALAPALAAARIRASKYLALAESQKAAGKQEEAQKSLDQVETALSDLAKLLGAEP